MNKLHVDILLLLRSAAQYGLTIEDLLTDLRLSRHHDLTKPVLEAVLRELADRSLVDPFTSLLQAKRWRILALGESVLKESKL